MISLDSFVLPFCHSVQRVHTDMYHFLLLSILLFLFLFLVGCGFESRRRPCVSLLGPCSTNSSSTSLSRPLCLLGHDTTHLARGICTHVHLFSRLRVTHPREARHDPTIAFPWLEIPFSIHCACKRAGTITLSFLKSRSSVCVCVCVCVGQTDDNVDYHRTRWCAIKTSK